MQFDFTNGNKVDKYYLTIYYFQKSLFSSLLLYYSICFHSKFLRVSYLVHIGQHLLVPEYCVKYVQT